MNAIGPQERQTSPSLCISQITTTYDPRQDRLRLEVADEDGRHMALWLTRRLADRVVAALVGVLEESGQPAKPSAPRTSRAKADAVEQLMQQAAADLRFRPVARRAPVSASEEFLLTGISLSEKGKSLALEFRWGRDGEQEAIASMTIDRVRLRQWMRIMYRVYVKSAWPLDHWPQWISDDAATQLLSENSLH